VALVAPGCTNDFDGLLDLGVGAATSSSSSNAESTPGAGGSPTGGGGQPAGGQTGSGGSAGAETGGTGGVTVKCAPGNSDQFEDAFDDNVPTGWMNYASGSASIEETQGELRMHVSDTLGVGNFAGYLTIDPLDLRGCSILLRAVALPADDVQAYIGFGDQSSDNSVAIGADAGTISFCVAALGVQECEDQAHVATDVWWRIRTDSTSLFMETSADGAVWAIRRTLSPLPDYVASAYANIGAGSQDPVQGSYDATLDDFNLPP